MMPATQQNPGFGLPPLDPNDPMAAGAYLKKMIQLSGGDVNLGLARYNAGPAGNLNNPETVNYVKKFHANLHGGQIPQMQGQQQPPQGSHGPQQGQSQQQPQIPPYQSMANVGQQPPQQQSQIGAPPKLDFNDAIKMLNAKGINDPQTILAVLDKNQARLSAQAQQQLAYQKEAQAEQDRNDRIAETGRHNKEMELVSGRRESDYGRNVDSLAKDRPERTAAIKEGADTRAAAAKAATDPIPNVGSNLHGEDYLKTLSPSVAATVKQIAEGRGSITSLSTKGGHREQILAMVNQYKPDYDAKDYGTEATGERAFTSGKQGSSIRSFNVGLKHLDTLQELGDALKNKDTNAVNKVGNYIASELGVAAPTNFEGAKKLVADEVVKAIVGSGGGVSDREEAAKTINGARSPEQLKGIIDTYKKLFNGQIDGLEKQYEASTKKKDFRQRFLVGGQDDKSAAAIPAGWTVKEH
jgi:hypothetical protein